MSKVNVFLTVDTEHSIGGAFADMRYKPVGNDRRIFYRTKDKDYGIPLIMDIADRFGLRLSFFLEVLNKYYFGENESRIVCRYILERGHDVQLHLHPNYVNFGNPGRVECRLPDQMWCYPLERQAELIREGIECLRKYGAPAPTAFRAGNYGANENTLKALAQNGIFIDSSYCRCFLGTGCRLVGRDLADADKIGDVWEFPVTNFTEKKAGETLRFRPLDINGTSFEQMRTVLNQAVMYGPKNVTFILHSFSFIQPLDLQYRRMRPRMRVIRRFEKLCRFLAENESTFHIHTYDGLNAEKLETLVRPVHHFPTVGHFLSVFRNVEQLMDYLPLKRPIPYGKKPYMIYKTG